MSVYDDLASKAENCKKMSRDDSQWTDDDKGKMFYFHRITSSVEASVSNNVINEEDVKSACQILHDLVQIDFRNIAVSIRKISDALPKEVLSVNNKTFQWQLEETAKNVDNLCDNILEFESQINTRLPIVKKVQEDEQLISYFITGKFENFK